MFYIKSIGDGNNNNYIDVLMEVMAISINPIKFPWNAIIFGKDSDVSLYICWRLHQAIKS